MKELFIKKLITTIEIDLVTRRDSLTVAVSSILSIRLTAYPLSNDYNVPEVCHNVTLGL